MTNILKRFSIVAVLIVLNACVTMPSSQQRYDNAKQLANSHKWHAKIIETAHFDLLSYHTQQYKKEKQLTIYIEGDGLAWLTKSTISPDPTPINPTSLKLALNHPQGNAVYLARPCQYTGGASARNCTKHDWTDSRFSEHVIASSDEAISKLKLKFSAENLQLVGYSGGGAVAALIAARRDDVVKLITVAGNLNHQAWTTHHHISPLSNSLNPADYHKQLASIEQIHFVGSDDDVIPPFLAQQFLARFTEPKQAKITVVPNQTHCCWENIWVNLIK